MPEYSEVIPKEPGYYVYRLWAADGTCLYVGITGERRPMLMRERLRDHRRRKSWWPQVARTEVASLANAQEIIAEERQQIAQLRPVHNGNLHGTCLHGHDVSSPDARTQTGMCKACVLEYRPKYVAEHRERIREYQREYRKREAPGVALRRWRRWYARHQVIPGQEGLW